MSSPVGRAVMLEKEKKVTKDHKGKEGKGQGHKETVRSGLGYYGCGLFAENAYLTENAQNGGVKTEKKSTPPNARRSRPTSHSSTS